MAALGAQIVTGGGSALLASVPRYRPGVVEVLRESLLPWLGVLAVAVVAQFGLQPLLGEYGARVAQQAGVYIIAAVSLNVVNGFTGQFSMGHAGFMAVGGYVAAFVTYYGSMLWFGTAEKMVYPVVAGVSLPLTMGHALMLGGIMLGGCVAAVLGLLVGLPSLRLRGDYLAIVTLGFGEIVRVMLEQSGPQMFSVEEIRAAGPEVWLKVPVGGALGISGIPKYADSFWIFLLAAATCLVAYRVKQSSTGRAFLSIREDEIAARAMGINLTAYKVRAFVFAAFFGGVAGGLLVHAGVPFTPGNAGFQVSFEIIIIVVLGGLGSVSGAVLAAVILSVLPELLRNLAEYRLILYALLLIGMMLGRPKGLLGVREIWEVFGEKKAGKSDGDGSAGKAGVV